MADHHSLAALSVLAAYGYLSGSPQSIEGFAHVGYPQQLRIILGIAKPLGAIALIVPGMVKLKEWAYAGFTFAWIPAFIAHYLAKDGAKAFAPLVFLLILAISYHPPGKPPVPCHRHTDLVKSESFTGMLFLGG